MNIKHSRIRYKNHFMWSNSIR